MQDFVNGGAFPSFSEEEPTGSEVRGYHPREIFEISRRNRCRTTAAVGKKWDASTSQSNNFGVSRKRFKPSTPGSSLAIQGRENYQSVTAVSLQHVGVVKRTNLEPVMPGFHHSVAVLPLSFRRSAVV